MSSLRLSLSPLPYLCQGADATACLPDCCWAGCRYRCEMAAMIQDWRIKWSERTGRTTNASFPFGWVQLNSNGGKPDSQSPYGINPKNTPGAQDPYGMWHPGFPSIRLAQTLASLTIDNTFQALILDTPIANGWVHSP